MWTSQVKGGATNAAPQWTKNVGLPRVVVFDGVLRHNSRRLRGLRTKVYSI